MLEVGWYVVDVVDDKAGNRIMFSIATVVLFHVQLSIRAVMTLLYGNPHALT